tara:strand:+ start:342 stop:1379 length:1038 start_codon:yes stop_codon:yes gene_type:complete
MTLKPKTIVLFILLILFGTILFYSNILQYPINCKDDDFVLNIPENATADYVCNVLDSSSCINGSLFKIAMYATFSERKVKPGLYSLKGIRTIRDLVILITSISNDRKRVTIYEGSNFQDIAKMLESQLNISSDRFISLCYDKNFIKSLGIDLDIPSLEGFLYPDTYVLLKTYNEKDVIKILTKRFMDVYNKEIYQMDSNMSILEIMSLASIIQGEAMIVEEMPIISSVYHNRLKRKMKLEADPTVLYFMNLEDLENFKKHSGTKKSTRIFKKYKKMKNPYNTYLNYGLPSGPINNPGLEAIKSAINPAQTEKKYYYFVADGSGGHIFTTTLKEHKRAIRKIRNGY